MAEIDIFNWHANSLREDESFLTRASKLGLKFHLRFTGKDEDLAPAAHNIINYLREEAVGDWLWFWGMKAHSGIYFCLSDPTDGIKVKMLFGEL